LTDIEVVKKLHRQDGKTNRLILIFYQVFEMEFEVCLLLMKDRAVEMKGNPVETTRNSTVFY
jgi:hypothetical protein